ncbi:MAG: phosphoribosylformylglycinamidine cyclo-ligase [Myxococcota bacterium]|nr:phosphoribosylformylglycinamidine cyclo-ligase [Myxococcota bacterium]
MSRPRKPETSSETGADFASDVTEVTIEIEDIVPSRKSAPEPSDADAAAEPGGAASNTAPSYARAGVDLDHDESFIDDVKDIVRGATRPEVLSSIGGFAGMFKTPERYDDPIWVAATDGVGTKLSLARQIGRYDTIGIDCVAMVVNDLVVQGAEPVVFLDYLAMSKLDRKIAADALRGIAEGCKRAGCALLGGETATMPGVYRDGDLEVVGFSVGVVERDRMIDGSTIREGDVLLGLASSGFHSNGYSLVRHVVDQGIVAGSVDLFAANDDLNTTLASALIAPTRIYVKPLLNVIRDFRINGLVHITGGGFDGNIPRILPTGVQARLDTKAWPRPGVFDWISRQGEISEDEMLRVFNCGIGMVLIVPREQHEEIAERLNGLGERAYRIGEIERRADDGPALIIDPGFLAGRGEGRLEGR